MMPAVLSQEQSLTYLGVSAIQFIHSFMRRTTAIYIMIKSAVCIVSIEVLCPKYIIVALRL